MVSEQLDKEIAKGVITRIGSRNYGFIKSEVGDVFFHINDAPIEIKIGKRVSFELHKGYKGYVAKNIKIIEEEFEESKRNAEMKGR